MSKETNTLTAFAGELTEIEGSDDDNHKMLRIIDFYKSLHSWAQQRFTDVCVTHVSMRESTSMAEAYQREQAEKAVKRMRETMEGLCVETDALKAKLEAFEKRPWPGCRVLSKGKDCDCSLCMADRENERLNKELKDLRESLQSYFSKRSEVERQLFESTLKNSPPDINEKTGIEIDPEDAFRLKMLGHLTMGERIKLTDGESRSLVLQWVVAVSTIETLSKLLQAKRFDWLDLNEHGKTIVDFQGVWLNQKDAEISRLRSQVTALESALKATQQPDVPEGQNK